MAMSGELDQLCSWAKELLGKMSLGWPRKKSTPGSQPSGLFLAKNSHCITIFLKRFHINYIKFSTQHVYEVGTIFTIQG